MYIDKLLQNIISKYHYSQKLNVTLVINIILGVLFLLHIELVKAQQSFGNTDKEKHSGLLFYLDGDQSYMPSFASGCKVPLIAQNIITVDDGKFGKALRFDSKSILRFAAPGNINRKRGTVCMWIKPDWNADDSKEHTLFSDDRDFSNKNNSLTLWKWIEGKIRFDIRDDREDAYLIDTIEWEKQEWHFVAIGWDSTLGGYLFLDGRMNRIKFLEWEPKESEFFQFGADRHGNWPANAIFDEIRIYDRPLSSKELCQLRDENKILVQPEGFNANAIKVFDFENKKDIKRLSLKSSKFSSIEMSNRFATSGRHSLVFKTKKWQKGLEQWPGFGGCPLPVEWADREKIVLDITNPTESSALLLMFISDNQQNFRQGKQTRITIPPLNHKRVTIPLNYSDSNVSKSKNRYFLFVTEMPADDICLYIDNISLLGFSDKLPALPSNFTKQIMKLRKDYANKALLEVNDASKHIFQKYSNSFSGKWGLDYLDRLAAKLHDIEKRNDDDFVDDVHNIILRCERTKKLVGFISEYNQTFNPETTKKIDLEYGVGFATSMQKILPRNMPVDINVLKSVSLGLAQNETESFQVAIFPFYKNIKHVQVKVMELISKTGEKFPSENISVDVMGYTKTEKYPPYEVPYKGWWPDPILDFIDKVDIACGDVQTFWVRVKSTKHTPCGIYNGKIKVLVDGMQSMSFDLAIEVYDFKLPDISLLPVAINFDPLACIKFIKSNWNDWDKKQKYIWADFLADYYITYDQLYRPAPPDFDVIQYLQKKGRLSAFNLGSVMNAGTTRRKFSKDLSNCVDYIKKGYKKACELGLEKQTYIYGFDELPSSQFTFLQKTAIEMNKIASDAMFLTTAQDHSLGTKSIATAVDAWCPLTGHYNLEKARIARSQGKKVWWYICCWPVLPYANWFIEYPAIDARLLMGAMVAKYRPDGFLYYHINLWRGKPIETGPFTNWNPRSYNYFHGDGSLVCVTKDGRPVPTIRLENFRDGLEDYAYWYILKEKLKLLKTKNAKTEAEKVWIAQAESLLNVPEALVNSLTDFTRNPKVLYDYRLKLARHIMAGNTLIKGQ